MSDFPKVCFERRVPMPRAPLGASAAMERRLEAAFLTAKLWDPGATLKIKFLEGSSEHQDVVRQFAPEWTQYANLKFDWVTSGNADIRITFRNDGAWSYVGRDALGIPSNVATMNFGWLDQGVVLHEFGHAVGLIHEHQNPEGGIQWNRTAVIQDLSGPPNDWDLETIEHNIFRKYALSQVNATQLDKKSIMLYAIPKRWTLDSFQSEPNEVLSDIDKSHARDVYPGVEVDAGPPELTVNRTVLTGGVIGAPGEVDQYRFQADAAGRYVIETTGTTDVLMSLFGPNDPNRLVARDDDSGPGTNARIDADLGAGEYLVNVRHFSAMGQGPYAISVILQQAAAAAAAAAGRH